jgi:ATP-dependent DNA helicase RecG
MTADALHARLHTLIAGWEHECVEFKEANDNYPTADIGKYFSALSNEANLRGRGTGWLIFGVRNRDRAVVGTDYREDRQRLDSLKQQIAQSTSPSSTFREIHEIRTGQGRVLMLEIPAAPKGIPIACNGHHYARNGESLVALSLTKLDELRGQAGTDDWSAAICPAATLDDLDNAALRRARDIFAGKFADRIPEATMRGWDDATFLDQAKLTIRGNITRAALLLVGRRESTHLLNPWVAEISWKLEGEEQDYEHFHPPFLLETSRLYQRIRNVRLRLERPGELIPVELPKYDQRIVLEALHNCIAHQDYARCERVLVIERPGELVFQNAGGFFDGTPEDYVLGNRTPGRYRNRFLAEAMVNLRMIDTMGFGIRDVMFRGQMKRYLPLPDFDLNDPAHVVLHLPGRFIDANYSRALLMHGDVTLAEALALDHIQKGQLPDEAVVRTLRKRGMVEGRKGRLHVTGTVATATDTVGEYLSHRGFDDRYYCDLILEYLRTKGEARRPDIHRLLQGKLSDLLSDQQKKDKVRNLLQRLRSQGLIVSEGRTKSTLWRLAP